MDAPASQYSSRSESGWTLYLDEFSASGYYFQGTGVEDDMAENRGKGTRIAKENEDLSMVSDASSGPPHYSDSHGYEYYTENQFVSHSSTSTKSAKGKRRNKMKGYSKTKEPSYLDDTASSPVLIRYKEEANTLQDENVEDFVNCYHKSQGAPTEREGNPSSQKHFRLFQAGVDDNENDEPADICLDSSSCWKR